MDHATRDADVWTRLNAKVERLSPENVRYVEMVVDGMLELEACDQDAER